MFGEGFELQRVKGVLTAADVLHCVFPSAALAEEETEEEEGGGGRTRQNGRNKKKVEMTVGVNGIKTKTFTYSWYVHENKGEESTLIHTLTFVT